MQEEFELTYLIKRLPDGFSTSLPSKEILDIYIPKSSEHAVLRLRKRGDAYEMTKKLPVVGKDSSHQTENTIPLTMEEFDDLSKIEGKRVRKIRYYYTENGIDFEIDVFKDALEGLVLVDIEFNSNKEKGTFVPPDWLLTEVTQEKAFAGGVLSGKSYADIEEKLSEYNYKPIRL
jgi:CYTH domain-containing protein